MRFIDLTGRARSWLFRSAFTQACRRHGSCGFCRWTGRLQTIQRARQSVAGEFGLARSPAPILGLRRFGDLERLIDQALKRILLTRTPQNSNPPVPAAADLKNCAIEPLFEIWIVGMIDEITEGRWKSSSNSSLLKQNRPLRHPIGGVAVAPLADDLAHDAAVAA